MEFAWRGQIDPISKVLIDKEKSKSAEEGLSVEMDTRYSHGLYT